MPDFQHLILDFAPKTLDNALAAMERCIHDLRPALG
jgi:hypothetical protein